MITVHWSAQSAYSMSAAAWKQRKKKKRRHKSGGELWMGSALVLAAGCCWDPMACVAHRCLGHPRLGAGPEEDVVWGG